MQGKITINCFITKFEEYLIFFLIIKFGNNIMNIKKEKFTCWIDLLALAQKRLYYRDQTPGSLCSLIELVKKFSPTKIIEIGSLFGLSLRAWLEADTNAEIIAVDLSFKPLLQTRDIIPVDLSRVKLIEKSVMEVDFKKLWTQNDRVLFYLDAHDEPGVNIIDYIVKNVVPYLPTGSILAIDDLWYSSNQLTKESALDFFDKVVTPQFDPIICRELYYAPYWKGGSFVGFLEVIPLMKWVNNNNIELTITSDVKMIYLQKEQNKIFSTDTKSISSNFDVLSGPVKRSPVDYFYAFDNNNQQAQQALNLCQQGIELFNDDKIPEAYKCFDNASNVYPLISGISYSKAVCLARVGQFNLAMQELQVESKTHKPHPKTKILFEDIHNSIKKFNNLQEKNNKQRITIFAAPKPFHGKITYIQYNAIKSWKLLRPEPEIILFGDEQGVAEIADELGIKHVADVKRNEFGTPLINSIFSKAQEMAANDILVYINADIIIMSDIISAVQDIASQLSSFLIVGQRWDVDIDSLINYNHSNWENELRTYAMNNGEIHEPTGIDYFIFNKSLKVWNSFPDFPVGRILWDNISIFYALKDDIPVVDATKSIFVVHQNHDYSHLPDKNDINRKGAESKNSFKLAGGFKKACTINNATWELTGSKLKLKEKKQKCNTNLCLFVTTSYHNFFETFYSEKKNLISESYNKQLKTLLDTCFGNSKFYSRGLKECGWRAENIFKNITPLQLVWAKENNFKGNNFEIFIKQLKYYKPQVVYMYDMNEGSKEVLDAIRPHTKLIVGQIENLVLKDTDFKGFDIIFSSLPHFVSYFKNQGINAYYKPMAFEPDILKKIDTLKRIYPVTFIGTILKQYQKRINIMEKLAELTPIEFWGENDLPANSHILKKHHGTIYGMDMYKLFAQSQIVINQHNDISENYANNIRLFEATGCGALLITDYKDNLNELFEIGKEIVVYRSIEECIELIKYYLNNSDEAQKIAKAGQLRTLRNHTYSIRMKQIDAIFTNHLQI